jgi:hypothetical protein
MTGIKWEKWGGPVAIGVGTLHLDECRPNCAEGKRVGRIRQVTLKDPGPYFDSRIVYGV